MTSAEHLEELEATARYHRERLELYRAKVYGPRPTAAARLHELERVSQRAEQLLRRAKGEPAR